MSAKSQEAFRDELFSLMARFDREWDITKSEAVGVLAFLIASILLSGMEPRDEA